LYWHCVPIGIAAAAGAGAKPSLVRPPPRGGLVTSAILSVRRATAVYTISTFW